MPVHNLERFDFRYWLLKPGFVFYFNRLWYRKSVVIGKENIPENTPLMMLSNHQNALIDPLAIVFNIKGQPVFLARSDIFKGKLVKSLLYFVKILPVFRIRDGKDNLQQNDYTFQRCVEILRKKKKLCMMPEGNHDKFRKLRPLKKGFARIAFMSEEAENFNLGLKILPIGIDYGSYYNFRTTLFVNIGKPIDMADFTNDYKENQPKTMLKLMSRVSEELSKLMIDIQPDEYYDVIYQSLNVFKFEMAEIAGKNKLTLQEKFIFDKNLIECFNEMLVAKPEKMDGYRERMNEYQEKLKEYKIRDWVVRKGAASGFNLILKVIGLILSLPVFIYGYLNNLIPYYLPLYFTRKVKDPQFLTTFRYGVSMFSFLVFYILQTLIVWLVSSWEYALLYLLSLPLTGLFAFKYYIWFKKLSGLFRFKKLKKSRTKDYAEITELRISIINIIREISENKLKFLVKS